MTIIDTVKFAKTNPEGWGIAIMRGKAFKTGREYFEVVRCNPENRYVTLERTFDLTEARKIANQRWYAERNFPA